MIGRFCRLFPGAVSYKMNEPEKEHNGALEELAEEEYVGASP
jgi:hypothetical protein